VGAASKPGERSRLLAVAGALVAGRRIRICYQDGAGGSTRRTVSPLGLSWRHGHWLLAAHCHLRRALRHFRVDRMEAVALAAGRIDGRLVPPGFDARFFSAEGYLRPGLRPPALATVLLAPPLSRVARSLFPAALLEWPADGRIRCHLRVSDRPALTQLVESLGPAASLEGVAPCMPPVHPEEGTP